MEHSRLKCGTLLDSLFRIRRIILCTLVLHRVPFHHKESVVYARLSDIRNATKIFKQSKNKRNLGKGAAAGTPSSSAFVFFLHFF